MSFKIYTKTGDAGETSLFGGKRLSKADLRIETYGTIDELNAFLGVLHDHYPDPKRKNEFVQIQMKLFNIGSILASEPGKKWDQIPDITNSDIKKLEQAIDQMDGYLEPLKNFILPGGHPAISYAHVARTVCRRAERLMVGLHHIEPIDPLVLKFVNRLSDYFFTIARDAAHQLNVQETIWKPE
ncbi:MAG: cob(I)yrinic acid a,c-diamide adenosyltransferase [Bacteroidota bacterium]